MIKRFLNDPVLEAVQLLQPVADDLCVPMANLAIAWVLANVNVAGAIVGASRPEQITSNANASGISLNDDVLKRVDEVLGDLPETDPTKTASPATRPA